MNELIEALVQLNQSGLSIPLQITQTTATNWSQFGITLMVSIIGSFFIFIFLWGSLIQPKVGALMAKVALRKVLRKTKRHILFIKHTRSGFFNMSMITQETMLAINKAFLKFKGKPFDLILHTGGGEVFSSIFISKMLKEYGSNIRVFVPFYSMSGGSLLALSGNELHMSKTACISPIDPQIGNFLSYGSTSSWKEIMKIKGKKADDKTIGFAFMGNQYTKSIKDYIEFLLKDKMDLKKRKVFSEFLTSGKVEHSHMLGIKELGRFGLKVNTLDDSIAKKLEKVISSEMFEGVYYI